MARSQDIKRFLEPVYLNEKMMLNCAAYLFGGVALESEVTKKSDTSGGGSVKLGLPFLQSLLGVVGVEGDLKRATSEESRAARRYTVGGLHMSVLDELNKHDMFFHGSAKHVPSLIQTDKSYVEIPAVLRPVDYYMLIGTLKAAVPLVGGQGIHPLEGFRGQVIHPPHGQVIHPG
ncbi:MAG: hypothetical protein M1401_16185 [Chloroflexi bacterium]|nr:hypothetical protein [Chloroflexota bacterium]